VLATNTSSFPLTRIAAGYQTRAPGDRMHFNESGTGDEIGRDHTVTPLATVNRCHCCLNQNNWLKVPCVVNDYPGFYCQPHFNAHRSNEAVYQPCMKELRG